MSVNSGKEDNDIVKGHLPVLQIKERESAQRDRSDTIILIISKILEW